jgi:hypothetical protein
MSSIAAAAGGASASEKDAWILKQKDNKDWCVSRLDDYKDSLQKHIDSGAKETEIGDFVITTDDTSGKKYSLKRKDETSGNLISQDYAFLMGIKGFYNRQQSGEYGGGKRTRRKSKCRKRTMRKRREFRRYKNKTSL